MQPGPTHVPVSTTVWRTAGSIISNSEGAIQRPHRTRGECHVESAIAVEIARRHRLAATPRRVIYGRLECAIAPAQENADVIGAKVGQRRPSRFPSPFKLPTDTEEAPIPAG
jgi:hypothetical protein